MRCLQRPQLGNVQILVCKADFGILYFVNAKQMIVLGTDEKPDAFFFFGREVKIQIIKRIVLWRYNRYAVRYYSIPKIGQQMSAFNTFYRQREGMALPVTFIFSF